MAKVAKVVSAPSSLHSDSPHFCGGNMKVPVVKRKTPSELRGEQLKRRIAVGHVQESSVPSEGTDGPRTTRYIDTRLDEVFPARKPTSRLSLLTGKLKLKENQMIEDRGGIKSSVPSHLTPKNHQELTSTYSTVANAKDSVMQQCQNVQQGSQNRFQSVAELSLGSDRFAELGTVDMDKVLKGLAAGETSGSCSPPNFARKSGDLKSTSLGSFCSEIHVPVRKVPLDLTLKTTMRLVSSSPLDRFHRLLMGGTYSGMTPFSSQCGYFGSQNISFMPNSLTCTDSVSLYSWIYPQSSLPPSVMSLLSSSKGKVETDFLNKRQLAWEDSFRSLYYTLRKSGCNVFYVCTSQFVVMFTAADGLGEGKRIFNAYISQSTRGLRSLLKEHDICFSMPLCCSEVEQISREDLVELSEIEKHNLGQAKRLGSMPDVDNSPRSLLAFKGNDSVHGLYDFLLNYRSLLTMLIGMDVPVLCAPIPFLNAAISSPEVKCKEFKRAEASETKGMATKGGQCTEGSTGGISCYSIEIKDAYLPPWIICSICAAMGSDGRSFEASFTTEQNSMGLNVALEALSPKSDTDEMSGDSQQFNNTLGISSAFVSSHLGSSTLKGLKYSNGSHSYVASLSPV